MPSWSEFEADAPEFAGRVRALFDSGTNKTLATLRADGSPRISGSELQITDGRVTLGMMAGSVKHRGCAARPPRRHPLADAGAAERSGAVGR